MARKRPIRMQVAISVNHAYVLLIIIVVGLTESKDVPCDLKPHKTELKRRVEVPYENDIKQVLICLGNVTLASCEGECVSEVLPSVLNVGLEKVRCT